MGNNKLKETLTFKQMLRFVTSLTIAIQAAQAIALQMEGEEAAVGMCKKYDKNRDGTLSYEEFQTVYTDEFDGGKASRPFKTYDENKDKKISCEEFTAFYCEEKGGCDGGDDEDDFIPDDDEMYPDPDDDEMYPDPDEDDDEYKPDEDEMYPDWDEDEWIEDYFKEFDKNNDKRISKKEYMAVQMEWCFECKESEVQEYVDMDYEMFDKNEDGFLSFKEFEAIYKMPMPEPDEYSPDEDGDDEGDDEWKPEPDEGDEEDDEWKPEPDEDDWMPEPDEYSPDEGDDEKDEGSKAEELFEKYDSNRDEMLSLKEFRAYLAEQGGDGGDDYWPDDDEW